MSEEIEINTPEAEIDYMPDPPGMHVAGEDCFCEPQAGVATLAEKFTLRVWSHRPLDGEEMAGAPYMILKGQNLIKEQPLNE